MIGTKIKIGSDCAGVGAFPQSLKRLKIEYKEIFACDFDYYARQTYLLNFGTELDIEIGNSKEHKYYSDGVKRIALQSGETSEKDTLFLIEANEFAKKFSFYFPFNMYQREVPKEPIDIYVSSVPCQAFSMAGKRLGKEDQRGILFFNSLEFIRENQPRYFIFENVKGLLSHDKPKNSPKEVEYGRTFQEWINYLGGKSVNGIHTFFPYEDSVPYHIYFQVLNAKNYGIPQNRERVFIIGIRDDADNNFTFPKPFSLEKRLKDVLEAEVDEKYFLSDEMISGLFYLGNKKYINQKTQSSTVFSENEFSPTICSGNNGYSNGYVETKIGTWRTHEDGKGFREMDDNLCPTIPARAREDGSGQPVIKMLGYTRDEKGNVTSRHEKDIAGTLHTSSGSGGNTDQFVIGAIRGRNPENPKSRESGSPTEQMLEINENGTSNALTTVQKDNVVIIPANNSKGFDKAEEEEDSINFSFPNSKTRRGQVGKKVSQTLDTQCNQGIVTSKLSKQQLEKLENLMLDENVAGCITEAIGRAGSSDELIASVKRNALITQRIRRLTPTECFRLMDFNFGIPNVPDFKWNVSDSQAYKQAGNSICVGVLAAIIQKFNLK